jgi:hypothetical protein
MRESFRSKSSDKRLDAIALRSAATWFRSPSTNCRLGPPSSGNFVLTQPGTMVDGLICGCVRPKTRNVQRTAVCTPTGPLITAASQWASSMVIDGNCSGALRTAADFATVGPLKAAIDAMLRSD